MTEQPPATQVWATATRSRNHAKRRHIRGCTGKKRHATAEDAVAFAGRMAKHHGALRPYECYHCGGWHLTTQV